jgi:hypothetical protein
LTVVQGGAGFDSPVTGKAPYRCAGIAETNHEYRLLPGRRRGSASDSSCRKSVSVAIVQAANSRRSDWMNKLKISICALGAGMIFFAAQASQAQDLYGPQGQQLEFNLFQNMYTPQGASQTTAGLYPAPHPVPYWVGGSQYTYQPFYPHQHLYWHSKNYYNYNGTSDQYYSDNQRHGQGGDSLNKTTVVWKGTGYHMGNLPFSSYAAQKLIYGVQAHKYGLRSPERGMGGGSYQNGGCPAGACR